mmetsp:Transcript_8362/g.15781  ORF Transcript_8362/g.15781 Transcript_8362/m.15781 type:complete len:425 (+) Transcript_8362:595-1869(+)
MMPPNESFAYAHINTPQSHLARFLHYCRQHASALTVILCFSIFVILLAGEEMMKRSSPSYHGLRVNYKGQSRGFIDPHWGGASHAGYFTPQSAIMAPNKFRFAAVTDMDQLSRVPGSDKPIFQSHFMPGVLTFDTSTQTYSVQFGDMRTLVSGHNEAGRGMELSEMTLYQNRLLAFDDRTGSIFEILSKSPDESFVVPRFVITEGEGDTDKGMKWEWATVKGNELYIGSMGKEYTKPDGTIVNTNNLWIAIVNSAGDVMRKDWSREYGFVRHLLKADPPGYVIHEAVLWSEQMKKWVFIPRRVSSEKYDDVVDERKGTNKVVLVNEDFTQGEVIDIKMNVDPLHGFSTAAFVPNSNERHVAALRSVEEDCVGGDENTCKQRSYIMVFDVLTGDVLMDEVKFEQNIKFEGFEFVDITISPFTKNN